MKKQNWRQGEGLIQKIPCKHSTDSSMGLLTDQSEQRHVLREVRAMFVMHLISFISFPCLDSLFINLLYSCKNFFKHFSEHLNHFGFDKIFRDGICAGDNHWQRKSGFGEHRRKEEGGNKYKMDGEQG